MKKYLAEFLGTFILTFMVCGAVSFTGGYAGYLGVVGIALTGCYTFLARYREHIVIRQCRRAC